MSKSDPRRFVVEEFDLNDGTTVLSAELCRAAKELEESGRFLIEVADSCCFATVTIAGIDRTLVVIFERIELSDTADDIAAEVKH